MAATTMFRGAYASGLKSLERALGRRGQTAR